jgi:hypothetical protein
VRIARQLAPVFCVCLILASGCATRGPKVISEGSDAEIDAAAVGFARADIAAGKPRVCYAGTWGVSAVGVPADSINLVSNLPRFPLPCGCTDPLSEPAIRFARAYNAEIVRRLREVK